MIELTMFMNTTILGFIAYRLWHMEFKIECVDIGIKKMSKGHVWKGEVK